MTPLELFNLFTDFGIEFELLSIKTSYLCDGKVLAVWSLKVKTWQFDELLIDVLLDKTELSWTYGRLGKGFYFVNFYFMKGV
jgi:hypothetical protein